MAGTLGRLAPRLARPATRGRGLYTFAWTRLMAGDSFPDEYFFYESMKEAAAPTSLPPALLPTFSTPVEIVEGWAHPAVKEPTIGPLVVVEDVLVDSTSSEIPTRVSLLGYRSVPDVIECIKRTFQPSLIRRKRKWGFLVRLRDRNGRKVLARRRQKRRWRLAM
mmetsp:Transcript_10033/g.25508  ORF Transcript_10033/g.25508 Transcript_10033/m.25508 type:complete len:164 (+) Transcript_10033:29-520(+)